MAGGEAYFSDIGEILRRRHRVSRLDPRSGTLELHDEDRTVRVTLEPDLLAEYFDRLDERDIPDLAHSPQDARDRVRARRVALWIEEIFESDIQLSLLEVRLDRSSDGRISLVDRRGSARRPHPATRTESGSWSPDRPGA